MVTTFVMMEEALIYNGDCDDDDEDHGGPGDKRMLTDGAPTFEKYRKSHKERKAHK